jgi:hypothetical protein
MSYTEFFYVAYPRTTGNSVWWVNQAADGGHVLDIREAGIFTALQAEPFEKLLGAKRWSVHRVNRVIQHHVRKTRATSLKEAQRRYERDPGHGVYYLQDTRSLCGQSMMFWVQDGLGYSVDVRKAQLFKKGEAPTSRGTDQPWPADMIRKNIELHVDVQDLREGEPWRAQAHTMLGWKLPGAQ